MSALDDRFVCPIPELTFRVYGEPIPQGSSKAYVHRRSGRAIVTSDNPRTKGWRHQVAGAAIEASQRAGGFFAGAHEPIRLTVCCVFRRPTSVSAKKRPEHVTRPDCDKLARSVGDALTGVLYHDDSQVVSWTIDKRYAAPEEPAGALITVRRTRCS